MDLIQGKGHGMSRLDTQLESEGAEFLVLGNLLIEGIPAYKAYTRTSGFDLVAVNPERNSPARIQVKSRWATSATGFLIKNIRCDFVIIAKLNRGKKGGGGKKFPPKFYVVPAEVVRDAPRTKDWGRLNFRSIPNFEDYAELRDLIREFLAGFSAGRHLQGNPRSLTPQS